MIRMITAVIGATRKLRRIVARNASGATEMVSATPNIQTFSVGTISATAVP